MRKTKYVIELTDTERQYAQKVINDKTTVPTFKKRAQVVLALDTNVWEPATQMEVRVVFPCGCWFQRLHP
ncbi:MAG: hypothetical protein LBF92_01955 [Synergistaceae bacterium]|nr:hypothetical protein [Synergistaceae bacterium]